MSRFLEKLASLGFTSYTQYLKSDHWASFRKANVSKSCWVCNGTGLLHLHHTTYENLGDEHPSDVVTVCQSCHKKIHRLAKRSALADCHIRLREHLLLGTDIEHKIPKKSKKPKKAKRARTKSGDSQAKASLKDLAKALCVTYGHLHDRMLSAEMINGMDMPKQKSNGMFSGEKDNPKWIPEKCLENNVIKIIVDCWSTARNVSSSPEKARRLGIKWISTAGQSVNSVPETPKQSNMREFMKSRISPSV